MNIFLKWKIGEAAVVAGTTGDYVDTGLLEFAAKPGRTNGAAAAVHFELARDKLHGVAGRMW